MSAKERPDVSALRELEQIVRNLATELASFRKRALTAEAKLKELSSTEGGAAGVQAVGKVSELRAENARLQHQLDAARTRTSGILDQVRFLRQQTQGSER